MEKEKKPSKYTEAKKRNNRNWDAANLDRLSVAAPKGSKERWKAAAEERGQSLNQFIVESVETAISVPERPQEAQTATAVQGNPQDGQTTQTVHREATESVPLHTLEQRIRKKLYKFGVNIRKDRKSGAYTVVYEDKTLIFPDFAALLDYAQAMERGSK